MALSSIEAEYTSMRVVTAELSWLTRLLLELLISSIQHMPMKCNSLAAIYIAKNPVFHERTNHVELDYHFVREKLHEGLSPFPIQRQLNKLQTYSRSLFLVCNIITFLASREYPEHTLQLEFVGINELVS